MMTGYLTVLIVLVRVQVLDGKREGKDAVSSSVPFTQLTVLFVCVRVCADFLFRLEILLSTMELDAIGKSFSH